MKKDTFSYRINSQIKSDKVRVIGPDGKQVGVLKLSEALEKANELKLDLIEIAPNAVPPVAKITELGKFKYQEEKKKKKEKRGIRGGEVKEIRFSPFIAEADFTTRLERIKEFLGEGNKVRLVVKFKGRQMGSKGFGYDVIKKVISNLEQQINVDMEPKFIGRHLTSVISPTNKGNITVEKEELNENAKT